MPGFPVTAWALRHPWGTSAHAVLDRLREPSSAADGGLATPEMVASALLDELSTPCERACERWGASRVAAILGSAVPIDELPLDRLSSMMAQVRHHTGIAGPAYHVVATGVGEIKALVAADRLLRASLVDAVLVGGMDDDRGAMLLVERHGDAFVELRATAEAVGPLEPEGPDEAAMGRVLATAWAAVGRPPLGYVHTHYDADDPHGAVEHRVLHEHLGAVVCCSTRASSPRTGAAASSIDAVLAVASLVRGYTPEAVPRELEHDRVLMHALSRRGHHVAVLFEARAT